MKKICWKEKKKRVAIIFRYEALNSSADATRLLEGEKVFRI